VTSFPFTIRPALEEEWPKLRALRLEALADTPIAFGETLATAEAAPDAHWRSRARTGNGRSIRLFAVTNDGRWVGTMGGMIDTENAAAMDGAPVGSPTASRIELPTLVGVYVSPDFRGREAGVTDALLDAVEEWAVTVGTTLSLRVHESNIRAQALYSRRGFAPTGRRFEYRLAPGGLELEMRKTLEQVSASARLDG
jgi:ribosomal protein S18 acetylase RimI-like enzyme